MPQLAYTLIAPPQPFVASGLGTASTSVRAGGEPITVQWHGVAPSVIAPGTVAGPGAVDTSADLYLIVATVGSAALTLITLADALTSGIDTILPGAQWGIVGELDAGGVRKHQQTPADALTSGSASLVPGAEGDILIFKNGAWITLHRDANGDLLELVNGYPSWQSYASIAGTGGTTPTPVFNTIGGTADGLGALYDARGGEPSGWQNPGFVPSGWTTSVGDAGPIAGDTNPDPPWQGTTYITGLPATDNYPYLYIQAIPVPAAAFDALQLGLKVHDEVTSVYINGILIASSVDPGQYDHVVTVPAGTVAPGTTCYLALRLHNDSGAVLVDAALMTGSPAGGAGTGGSGGGGGGGSGGGGTPGTTGGNIIGNGYFFDSRSGEPSGWQNPGFTPSGWIPSTAFTYSSAPYPGTSYVQYAGAATDAHDYLYVEAITLPAGAITSATFKAEVHDHLLDVYLNGTLISHLPTPGGDGYESVVPLTGAQLSLLHPGAANTVALRCHNDSGPPLMNYILQINGGAGSVGGGSNVTIEKDGAFIGTFTIINFQTPSGTPTGTLSVTQDGSNPNQVNVKYS